MLSLKTANARKKPKNNRPQKQTNACPPYPPQFNAAIQFKHRFRFQSVSNNTTTITTQNLMSLLVMQSSSTDTNLYSLYSAFRLRKIYVWSASGDVSVEFIATDSANIGARPAVISDLSLGTTYLSKICAIPPRTSAAATWQNVTSTNTTTTGAQFQLTAPSGSIIDVIMDIVLQNNDPTFSVQLAAVPPAQVAGTVYQNYLDGLTTAAYPPVSYLSPNT